jgi:hypothetical protein
MSFVVCVQFVKGGSVKVADIPCIPKGISGSISVGKIGETSVALVHSVHYGNEGLPFFAITFLTRVTLTSLLSLPLPLIPFVCSIGTRHCRCEGVRASWTGLGHWKSIRRERQPCPAARRSWCGVGPCAVVGQKSLVWTQ